MFSRGDAHSLMQEVSFIPDWACQCESTGGPLVNRAQHPSKNSWIDHQLSLWYKLNKFLFSLCHSFLQVFFFTIRYSKFYGFTEMKRKKSNKIKKKQDKKLRRR